MLKHNDTIRPDNLFKSSLLILSFCLITLTIVLSLFLRFPEYFIYLNLAVIVLTIVCLMLAATTLKRGEKALTYGGFANELVKKNRHICRIDNVAGEAIIQNDAARDFFSSAPILPFLQEHLADTKSNMANFLKIQQAAQSLKYENVEIILNLNNEEKHYMISITPLFLKKEDIFEEKLKINRIKNDVYICWNLEDITAEKNIEQIFFEERKYLHDFLDFLPVGLYTCDKDYNIEYVNEAFAEFLNSTPARLKNNNLKNFVSKDCEFYEAKIAFEGPAYFNSEERAFVFQDSVRENKKVKLRGVVLQHLPSDKNLTHELYDSANKVSWLFDSAPIGIIFVDKAGKILNHNTKALQILHQELKENNILSLIKTTEEAEAFKNVLNGIKNNLSASSFTDIHLGTGEQEKILRIYATPMRKLHTNDSDIDGFVLYIIDATEQKNLELQFAQAQKMQAMGQLAGGVAHDFNNLLTSMIGFCDLLLQKHGVGDPSFSDLTQIKQSANRAAALVRQLLVFSRKQPIKPKLIDVTENFVDLGLMLRRIMGEQIKLTFYHGQNLGFIRVDPIQFSQVILNLAVNAKDAMNGKGELSISSKVERIDESFQFGDNLVEAGDFVVIDVTDTGCGISQENISRIFEPFFSTKQNVVGSGTGLGLAMVYGIVQQTKGFIKVKSKVGKGTTFSVYLPRFEGSEEEIVHVADNKDISQNQIKAISLNRNIILDMNVSSVDTKRGKNKNAAEIKILFAEDDVSVRTFAVRALEKKGFNVVACNSGENALEYLKKDKNFQLLITDMMMPGITGVQLAAEAKKQIPNLKTILASGYSEEMASAELKADKDFEFIAKPFSLADLTQKVFDMLNR